MLSHWLSVHEMCRWDIALFELQVAMFLLDVFIAFFPFVIG